MQTRVIGWLLALAFCLPASLATAQSAHAGFQVRLGALPVGELVVTHAQRQGLYEVRARFTTKGVAGAVAPVHFDLKANGRLKGTRPTPRHYVEDLDTSRRQSHANLTFAGTDTRIDPATALMISFTDRPLAQGCATRREVFDGTRSNRLTIAPGIWEGGVFRCRGRFQHLAGYSPAELARSKGFGFTLEFARDGAMLRARKAVTQSVFGQLSLRRK